MPDTKTLTVQRAQSAADKKATLDLLRGKRRRRKEIKIQVGGEDLVLVFQALSAHELDQLQGKHKPTPAQKVDGNTFNVDTFPPALVAACLIEPEVSEADVKEIWDSPEWSNGELSTLFSTAINLCTEGLDVPFFGNASV